MRSFFDTNILVYMFDHDAPVKKAQAQELLQKETEAGRALLSTQVLQEFYVTVTRKLKLPLQAEVAEEVVHNLAVLPLVEISGSHILGAISRSRRWQVSFWDALILEAAINGGATVLYSEDLQHGQVIEEVRIENPFSAAAGCAE